MTDYRHCVDWIQGRVDLLRGRIEVQFIERDNKGVPCVWIRLEDSTKVGELIVNKNGIGVFMVADVVTGNYLMDQHEVPLNWNDFNQCETFFSFWGLPDGKFIK